jgi:hypothetical protein
MQVKGADPVEAAKAAKQIFNDRKKMLADNMRSGLYNPKVDPETIAKEAALVSRDTVPNTVPAAGREGAVVTAGGLVFLTKGESAIAHNEEREEDSIGDGEAVRQEEGKESFLRIDQQKQDQGNRHENRGPQKAQDLIVETYEGESKEEVIEQVPKDFVSVTYKRLWRAYVVRRA